MVRCLGQSENSEMGGISWVVMAGSLSSYIDNVIIQDGCLSISLIWHLHYNKKANCHMFTNIIREFLKINNRKINNQI